jgi:outer membrane protein W
MKQTLMLIVMSAFSVMCFSQSNSLGINAGLGHAWLKNYDNSKYKPAGNFGLSFIHSTETNFGFGADLKYSFEGGKKEATVGNTTVTNTTSLHYVRVPLKLIYFFGKYGQKVRPKISAGPSFGFLAGGKDKIEVGNTTTEYESKDRYEGFDMGIHGTAGFNYRLVARTWLVTDVVYYHGFKNILPETSSSPRLSNRNIGISVGVNWGIGKD